MTANAKESDADTFLGRVMRCNSVRVGFFLAIGALLVRGGVCWQSLDKYRDDPDAYRSIAETLGTKGVLGLTAENGQAIATAFRPPLYPTLLSWFVQDQQLPSTAVACLHILMGVATVLFTYCAAVSMLPRDARFWGPALAAILVMVDPLLLQQSRLVMTETLAAMLVSVTLWWWACCRHKLHGALSGMTLGTLMSLAFLARPTFVAWAFLLVFATLVADLCTFKTGSGRDWKKRLWSGLPFSLAVVAVLVVVIGAWALRNLRAVGDPVWATTHGGYTLLLGNNPYFYDFLQNGSADGRWDSEAFQIAYSHRYDGDPKTRDFWQRDWGERRLVQDPAVVAVVSERSDDLLAYNAAKGVISRQPKMFLWSSGVRVLRLWDPFPNLLRERSAWGVTLIGSYNCCLYIGMLIGCIRLGRSFFSVKWLPVWTLFVTLTLVHAVYWSNIRMRAPAVPAMALLASAAVSPLRERSRSAIQSVSDRDEKCG